MLNKTEKSYFLIAIILMLGIILSLYGILNPKNPVSTYKSNNITVINIKKSSEPNYILFAGLIAIVTSISLILTIYSKNNKIKKLTTKEYQILQLIKQGKTNKEIAGELFISVSTVKTHINNIFKKMKISNRSELIQKI